MRDGDEAAVRWLSYSQIAALRGISRASAERMVRRAKWRRQVDNQGITRTAVPLAYAEPERMNPPDRRAENPPDLDVAGVIATLQGTVDTLRQQLVRADARADALQIERGQALADLRLERERQAAGAARTQALLEAAADLRAERNRVEQAEVAREGERSRAEARREQLEEAKEEASEAWERANETQRTEQGLRRELAAAESQATEAKERLSEAEGALAVLRRAYDERRARGRWARLRAAWRGE